MSVTKFNLVQADQFLGSQADASPFGKIWYVDSTNGADGNSGTSPDEAYSTLGAALTASVASRGDTIVIYPGTYTVTSTVAPKAYVTLKAAIVNPQAPSVIIAGNIASLVTVNVDGCRFVGIEFKATGTTSADLVLLASTASIRGPIFEDCVFNGATEGNYIHFGVGGFKVNSGTYSTTGLVVRRCLFKQLGRSLIDVGVLGIPDSKIEDNTFHINTVSGVGVRLADTAAVVTGLGFTIRNNDFIGVDSTTDIGIAITAAVQDVTAFGMIRTNYFAACLAAAITADKIEDCIIENYYGDATGGTKVDSGV